MQQKVIVKYLQYYFIPSIKTRILCKTYLPCCKKYCIFITYINTINYSVCIIINSNTIFFKCMVKNQILGTVHSFI